VLWTVSAVPVAAQESLIGTGFELMDVIEASTDQMGTVRAATDLESFDQLWSDATIGGQPVFTVDFERSIIVSFTIPDDACPPVLSGFERSGDVWEPIFVEPHAACVQPLIP
jgi:hypothetical protein